MYRENTKGAHPYQRTRTRKTEPRLRDICISIPAIGYIAAVSAAFLAGYLVCAAAFV